MGATGNQRENQIHDWKITRDSSSRPFDVTFNSNLCVSIVNQSMPTFANLISVILSCLLDCVEIDFFFFCRFDELVQQDEH